MVAKGVIHKSDRSRERIRIKRKVIVVQSASTSFQLPIKLMQSISVLLGFTQSTSTTQDNLWNLRKYYAK